MKSIHKATSCRLRVMLVLLLASMVPMVTTETTVTIAMDKAVAVVEDYFLSYAIDAYLLGEQPRWQKFDFQSTKLRTLMTGLKPALLRFGGGPADETVFTDDVRAQDHLNVTDLKVKNVFTKQDLDNMVNITKSTGGRFLFDLDLQLRFGDQWDPTNAVQMMQYIADQGYGDNIDFELGNEPDHFVASHLTPITAEQLAKDYVNMVRVVRSFSNLDNSMIVGPDPASFHKLTDGIRDVLNSCGKYMKAVTFHQYYFRGDTASVQDYLDPAHLGSLAHSIAELRGIVASTAVPRIPVWLGETSDAFHSGTAHVSDRFVSGFLWMDKLGISAQENVGVVVRQTLYGHNYGLINDTLDPNPDYWLSYLHKQLVGQKVLSVNSSGSAKTTRVYAHCQQHRKGPITLFALNANQTGSATLRLDQFSGQSAEAYVMTAPSNDVLSQSVAVNGQILKLKNDREFPDIAPKLTAANELHLPPLSLAFYVLKDAKAQACM